MLRVRSLWRELLYVVDGLRGGELPDRESQRFERLPRQHGRQSRGNMSDPVDFVQRRFVLHERSLLQCLRWTGSVLLQRRLPQPVHVRHGLQFVRRRVKGRRVPRLERFAHRTQHRIALSGRCVRDVSFVQRPDDPAAEMMVGDELPFLAHRGFIFVRHERASLGAVR